MAESEHAVKFLELDTISPIDTEAAIKTLGCKPKKYYLRLSIVEPTILRPLMKDLV